MRVKMGSASEFPFNSTRVSPVPSSLSPLTVSTTITGTLSPGPRVDRRGSRTLGLHFPDPLLELAGDPAEPEPVLVHPGFPQREDFEGSQPVSPRRPQ